MSTTTTDSRDWSKIQSAKRRLERTGFGNVTETPIGNTVTAIDFHITDPVWATKRKEGSSLIINGGEFGTFTLRFPLIDTETVSRVRLEQIGETIVNDTGIPDLPLVEAMPHENEETALHISYEQGANEILTVDEAVEHITSLRDAFIEQINDELQ